MRVLTGMGLFNEIAQDTFTATPLASAYVTGSPLAEAVVHLYVYTTILSRARHLIPEHQWRASSCRQQNTGISGAARLSQPW